MARRRGARRGKAGALRMSGEVRLHPAWRHAVKLFREHGFRPGEVVSHDWLYDAFAIRKPTPDTPAAEAEKAKLASLAQFERFADALLNEDKVALASVRGLGYRIVPSVEQTGWAEAECRADLAKALRRSGDRIRNVDLARLSADQRRENADAQARLAALRSVTTKTFRKLPNLTGAAKVSTS